MIKVSVIISTYNRRKDLAECLDSLQNQVVSSSDFEIIVIDDGSCDRTEELFMPNSRWKNLQIVYYRQEKMGKEAAVNKGIKIARGKILAFIDSDCIAAKDWIRNIIYFHERFKDITTVQGKILNAFDNCYTAITEQEILDRYLEYFVSGNGQQKFIHILATGNCSMKIEVFREMDCAFSSGLFPCDDVDLAHQLLERNEKILYIENIIVKHKHRVNIFSYMKSLFRRGRAEYLIKRKWQKELRDYDTKEFRPINFALGLFRNFLIKYKLKGIIFFIIYVLRKFVRTSGYMYEKVRQKYYENIILR